MKKITALLLCFVLLCICSATTFAVPDRVTDVAISVTVPDTHKITVQAEDAQVFCEGMGGEEFVVDRLSRPRLLIRAESGKVIRSVTVNGVDVTDSLYGGYLELEPVYEDKLLVVTTEDAPAAVGALYTVKGTVTLNGQPLVHLDLELRSALQTAKTDTDGSFIFRQVEQGKHSLTALLEGRVIGYLSFELKEDNKVDLFLQENGTYSVSVDQEGVEMHLVLDEDTGMLAITDISTIEKEVPTPPPVEEVTDGGSSCCWWWWILLILGIICIVTFETYRRKKKRS